jgi:hypothetical protein
MVDENDFNLEDLQMMGDDGGAFDGIFDDDLQAEERKALAVK